MAYPEKLLQDDEDVVEQLAGVRDQDHDRAGTTHRVLIRRGVLTHVGRDIALQRISDVGFRQSLWDRMVGAGTLTIESAGENGEEKLANLPHSDRVQQTVNRLIEEDHDRRARQSYRGGA